jgi:hypothetical protein
LAALSRGFPTVVSCIWGNLLSRVGSPYSLSLRVSHVSGRAQCEQALRRLNCTMGWGLLSPGKEVEAPSEERRGSGGWSPTDLTRWRSRVEISSQLQKIEWFRGCRQGVNPSLSAGPTARAALWESRMRERRTANGQGSSGESNPNPSPPPALSSRQRGSIGVWPQVWCK